MPSQEDIAHQQSLLTIYRRNLSHYLKQQGMLGEAFAPPGIANGILEARDNIARIKKILHDWDISVEELPDDTPVIKQPESRSPSESPLTIPNEPISTTTKIDYQDFELRISRAEQNQYRVEVLRSPAGEASALTRLSIDNDELHEQVKQLRLPFTEKSQLVDMGQILYELLFPAPIARCWATSIGYVSAQHQGLNLRLRIDDAELARLPWELLYDSSTGRFLIPSTQTPLLRYIALSEPILPISIRLPLRILLAISSPPDYGELDIKREKLWITSALKPLFDQNMVSVDILEPTTRQTLQSWLRRDYHVLHYIGHGNVDTNTAVGSLVLTDETTYKASLQDAETLGYLLQHSSIRLVFLNACQTSVTTGTEAFLGVAQSLVRAGLPAVIAMQSDVPDTSAAIFARAFYGSLADGLAVQTAVTEGRKAVLAHTGSDSKDWAVPTLFMRSPTGILFTRRDSPMEGTRIGDVKAHSIIDTGEALSIRDQPEDQRSGGYYEVNAQGNQGVISGDTVQIVMGLNEEKSSKVEKLRLKLRIYQKDQTRLEIQALNYGQSNVPAWLLDEIKFTQKEISKLEEEIATSSSPTSNQALEQNSQVSPTELRHILEGRFSIDELHVICFDLGIDFENLRGETKSGKARELIAYLQRRGQMLKLIDHIRQTRPDISI